MKTINRIEEIRPLHFRDTKDIDPIDRIEEELFVVVDCLDQRMNYLKLDEYSKDLLLEPVYNLKEAVAYYLQKIKNPD